MDLRDVDEVRTTAGDVGAAADMVRLLYVRDARSRSGRARELTHWASSETATANSSVSIYCEKRWVVSGICGSSVANRLGASEL